VSSLPDFFLNNDPAMRPELPVLSRVHHNERSPTPTSPSSRRLLAVNFQKIMRIRGADSKSTLLDSDWNVRDGRADTALTTIGADWITYFLGP
jgi:hypothetical protein